MTSITQIRSTPLIADADIAIKEALEEAATFVARVTEQLAEHGGDFSKAYPYPSPHLSREDYFAGMDAREMAAALVTPRMREPAEYDIYRLEERLRQLHVVVDAERVATFFKRTSESVSASFDVGQLRARIGKLEAVLDDLLEFVDEYSDVVDGDDGDPEPNQAMSLITMARDVLEGRTL